MRLVTAAGLVLLCLPAPALATSGLLCQPLEGAGPALSLVIGHGIGVGIAGANLIEEGRIRSTFNEEDALQVGQSWIDSERVWLDLVDPRGGSYEVRLRADFQPRMRLRPAFGTLSRHGRAWRVRCEEA